MAGGVDYRVSKGSVELIRHSATGAGTDMHFFCSNMQCAEMAAGVLGGADALAASKGITPATLKPQSIASVTTPTPWKVSIGVMPGTGNHVIAFVFGEVQLEIPLDNASAKQIAQALLTATAQAPKAS